MVAQAVAITAEMGQMKDTQHWECLQQDQEWGQLLSPAIARGPYLAEPKQSGMGLVMMIFWLGRVRDSPWAALKPCTCKGSALRFS